MDRTTRFWIVPSNANEIPAAGLEVAALASLKPGTYK